MIISLTTLFLFLFNLLMRFYSFWDKTPYLKKTKLYPLKLKIEELFKQYIKSYEGKSIIDLERKLDPYLKIIIVITIIMIAVLNSIFGNSILIIVLYHIAFFCMLFYASLKNWQEIKLFFTFHKAVQFLPFLFISTTMLLIMLFRNQPIIKALFQSVNINERSLAFLDHTLPYTTLLSIIFYILLGITFLFLSIINLQKKLLLILWGYFLAISKMLDPERPFTTAYNIIGTMAYIISFIIDNTLPNLS